MTNFHSVTVFSEISCPKKEHDVLARSTLAALSSLAMQIDNASRWVNERYANPQKITKSNIFETSDFTNLSTIKIAMMLSAIAPSPRFFAFSESKENMSIHLVWQEYDKPTCKPFI